MLRRSRRRLLLLGNNGNVRAPLSANATMLSFTTQPGLSGASPYTLSPQPVVKAVKSDGTTVDTLKTGTVTISLIVFSGAATLGGTTTKALSSGVADFSANSLAVTATSTATWALVATLSGLANATSSTGTTTVAANVAPNTPTISAGTPTSSGVTLTGSAFSDSDVGDTHAASQWQVTTSADTGYASPVISTGDDATNKTSYAATGLSASTAYIARVRYKDSAGNYSAWSTSASFTTASGFTAFDKGFNFRATSAFVTDGANETYSIYPEAYPTTRNGVTFGVTSPSGSVQARDRNAALDRRLAGTNWDSGEPMVFRVDLPAPGTYAIRLALGDENASTAGATIKDGATTRLNIPSVAVAAGHSLDATGADYTAAAWPGSNTPVSITMTGTVLTLTMPINNAVQHLFISRTA